MSALSVPALVGSLVGDLRARARTPLIGVSGAQGAGKSYQCRAVAEAHPRFAHFSMDDVYLTKAERDRLAQTIHPLFATRGPPGTHDLDLAARTLAALKAAAPESATPLPRFDKASDDRIPESQWPLFRGRPEAILVDGWCLGARAPEPGPPINAIEALDGEGVWRTAQATFLSGAYAEFFTAFDAILYLKPPSWEAARTWRAEQEAETLGRPLNADDEARLDRFMQHYERITRAMMNGAHCAAWVIELDERRNAVASRQLA